MDFTANMINLAAQVITMIVVGVLLPFGIKWLNARIASYNLSISEAQADLLEKLVVEGIHAAEEYARGATKTGSLPRSSEKLQVAIDFVTREANARNLTVPDRDRVKSLVESLIGQLRKDQTSPVVDN